MQVAFLRNALGKAAAPCPTLNVGSAFSAVINAALGSKATSHNFSPYTNDLDFLLGAFLFEVLLSLRSMINAHLQSCPC